LTFHLTGWSDVQYDVCVFDPEELIAIRQRLGLGKELMARVLGVGVSSVHRWERGDTGPTGPVLQLYRALRLALDHGHPPQRLLGDVGGDPGIVLARIFSIAFLEGGDATGRRLRGHSRAGSRRIRPRPLGS
jgi:transcriptional regulator with XRE-family HTH domain